MNNGGHSRPANARYQEDGDLVLKDRRDREVFVRAILQPPSPGKGLAAAANRYRTNSQLPRPPSELTVRDQ